MAWVKDGFVILFSPLVQAVAAGFAVPYLEPDQNKTVQLEISPYFGPVHLNLSCAAAAETGTM